MICIVCKDTGWICENHPDTPCDGEHTCTCGGAGMPCPECNPSDLDHPPRPAAGTHIEFNEKAWRHQRPGMVTRIRRSDRPPRGRKAAHAAPYVTGLPKKEAALPVWQAAIEALILVADRGGPTMFARIGLMRALNRHVERVFDPSRKEKHWGRCKLARDR